MTARPLVLAAHGSADPRFATVVDAVATRVRTLRPDLEVRVGYLEHGPPTVGEVSDDGCVVVPLLLSSGYHVLVDLPAQAPGALITAAVGPDPLLVVALADRLVEAGYDGRSPVVLGAAGSSDERSVADVRTAAAQLGTHLDVDVTAAFVSAATPRLSDVDARVVASYLLAPGAFHDALRSVEAGVVSEPVGDHPAVAQLVVERYDAATHVPGRMAPA